MKIVEKVKRKIYSIVRRGRNGITTKTKKMRDSKSDSKYDLRHWDTARRCQKPSHFQGEGLDGVCLAPWQQDGIAPQCAVPRLLFDQTAQTSFDEDNQIQYRGQRIQFDGENKHLNFEDAHYVRNYGWIFKIKSGDDGVVAKRD